MHPTDEDLRDFLHGRSDLASHLEGCPDCAGRARAMAAVDAELAGAFEEGKGVPASLKARRPRWGWAAAAAVLLAAGAWILRPASPPKASSAARPARLAASLEVEPGGEASLSGRVLTLKSGACWLDASVPVEMAGPLKVRFAAGTEAEVRILPPAKTAWSLLGEAWASVPPEVLVSVVSGSAEAGGLCIPAGIRARLPAGALEPLDASGIHAWRARRLEAGGRGAERVLQGPASFPEARGSFSAEVRSVQGHILLRYPAGETTLGRLDAWTDGAWHRLSVSWKGSGTEVFLDGQRILRVPKAEGSGTPGLEVLDGSLVLREIRP